MQPGFKQVIRHVSTEHVFAFLFREERIYIYTFNYVDIFLDTHKYILISLRIQDPPLE